MAQRWRAATRPRAVAYLRQSTYREESISLELQETACREHATREGYEIVAVEADPGISGRTFDRPAVQRVMGMIEAGEADVIVTWKWSRISRSRRDWALAADRVERAGGRIESATEAIDTSTSTGRLARGVMVEFAAFESERIGDVWREAHARRVAAGRPANGKPRFGYAYDREQKLHVPDPVTGPVLAECYRRYLAGDSVYTLVRWLNAEGIKTAAGYGTGPNKGTWSPHSLRRVLDSGFGAGLITVHGERLPGAHEPVITEHEWARYLRRREERRVRRRTERSEYLLSGLVRCHCGSSMQAGMHSTTGPRMRCRAAVELGAHKGGWIQTHYIESAVTTWLADTAAEVEAHVDITPRRSAPTRRRALEAERERTWDALTGLAMQLAEGAISPEVHARAARRYDERLTELSRELEREQERLAEPAPDARAVIDLARDWDLLPIARRREALAALLDGITVTPGHDRKIVITPRVGVTRSFRP